MHLEQLESGRQSASVKVPKIYFSFVCLNLCTTLARELRRGKIKIRRQVPLKKDFTPFNGIIW